MTPHDSMVDAETNDPRRYVDADPCAADAGIRVELNADGDLNLHLAVGDRMLNGIGVCHGGIVFLLADTALAYAARWSGGMHASSWATVSFLRPVLRADTLVASPRLVDAGPRRSHYDVDVRNQRGETVALFRGQAVRVDPEGMRSHG